MSLLAGMFGILTPLVLTRFRNANQLVQKFTFTNSRIQIYWRNICFINLSVPTLALVLIFWITPESPIWLLLRGKEYEARSSLLSIRGYNTDVDSELDQMKQSLSYKQNGVRGGKILTRLMEPEVWRPFLITNITFMLQVLTVKWNFYPNNQFKFIILGFVAIRGYTVLLFESTGSNLNAYDMVLISRCFTLLGQLVSSVAMPYIGRKVVYCVSCALTGVSLIGFGWAHWLHPLNSEPFAVATRNGTLEKCRLKRNKYISLKTYIYRHHRGSSKFLLQLAACNFPLVISIWFLLWS